SRYTCASDSSPLIARIECPNPIRRAMAVNDGHPVPSSHPSESCEKRRFPGTGDGGSCPPRISTLATHQAMRITTMTGVIFMIRRGWSLDSCRPRVLRHQKYNVTRTARNAAVPLYGTRHEAPDLMKKSLTSPAMY